MEIKFIKFKWQRPQRKPAETKLTWRYFWRKILSAKWLYSTLALYVTWCSGSGIRSIRPGSSRSLRTHAFRYNSRDSDWRCSHSDAKDVPKCAFTVVHIYTSFRTPTMFSTYYKRCLCESFEFSYRLTYSVSLCCRNICRCKQNAGKVLKLHQIMEKSSAGDSSLPLRSSKADFDCFHHSAMKKSEKLPNELMPALTGHFWDQS